MDGALAFMYVYVDSGRTVQEHHRSFIQSTLVSQLEEKKKTRVAVGDRTQGLLLY